MNKYRTILEKNNLTLIVDNPNIKFEDRIKFRTNTCSHNLESKMRNILTNIKKNTRYDCPECKKEKRTFTFKEVQEKVSKNTQSEYKVISLKKDYKNTRSKIKIFHKTCKKETEITYKNFSLGKRCRHCAAKTTNSKASQLLYRLLEQTKIEFIDEKTFEDCRNPITNKKLPFDFYIPKLNLLIEIDGEQHFIPVERFGGEKSLKSNKYRDFIKNKYCLKKEIILKRVSLLDFETNKVMKYDDVKVIIFNLLKDIALEYYKES